MEVYVLVGIIVCLVLYVAFKELVHLKQIEKLTDKLMSRDFIEYSNYELSKMDAKKENKPEKKMVF